MSPDAIFILLLGNAFLFPWAWLAGRDLKRALDSRRWPTTRGRIIRAERTMSMRNYFPWQWPVSYVRYRYEVEHSRYESNVVGRRKGQGTLWEDIDGILCEFEEGMPVKVYYDPTAPSRAALVPGATFEQWVAALAPLLAMVALTGYVMYRASAT